MKDKILPGEKNMNEENEKKQKIAELIAAIKKAKGIDSEIIPENISVSEDEIIDSGIESVQENCGMSEAAMEADYEAEQNSRPDYLDENGNPHWFDEEENIVAENEILDNDEIMRLSFLNDNKEIINYALNYFKVGTGNGSINNAIPALHTYEGVVIGQGQESGRDQGHAALTISLYGAYCQMAYNIGVDFFGYQSNKVLAMGEYAALYNLKGSKIADADMPFKQYVNCNGETHTIVSNIARGDARPSWELIYNHYAKVKKVPVKWVKEFAEQVRPEGGGGNYGPNSGGYDQLGFGTLMYTQE